MMAIIYFVCASGTDFIKIGATSDLSERLKGLQKSCPGTTLRVVHKVKVDYRELFKLERQLHRHFSIYRCDVCYGTREWFHLPSGWRKDVDFLLFSRDVVDEFIEKRERERKRLAEWYERREEQHRREKKKRDECQQTWRDEYWRERQKGVSPRTANSIAQFRVMQSQKLS